jgi:hypothetical protein
MAEPTIGSVHSGTTAGNYSASFNNVAGDYLYVWVWDDWSFSAENNVTSVTYAGAALTRIANQQRGGGGGWFSLWRLASPVTGSQTLAATRSVAGGSMYLQAITLVGADPAGYSVLATSNNGGAQTSGHTASITTTVADTLVLCGTQTGAGNVSVTAPATKQTPTLASDRATASLSAPTAGAYSVSFTQTSSWWWNSHTVSHAGVAAPAASASVYGLIDGGLVQ